MVPQRRRVIAAHEIGGIDLDGDHPAELAIGPVQPSGELQAPLARDRVAPRSADLEGIALAQHLQRLVVDGDHCTGPSGAGHQGTTAVADADIEEPVRREQASLPQFAEGRPLAPDLVGVLDHLQRLVDFAQGAHDFRLIGLELLAAGDERGAIRSRMVSRQEPERHGPDEAEHEHGEDRERQDGRDRACPPGGQQPPVAGGRLRSRRHVHARPSRAARSGPIATSHPSG